MMVRDVNLSPKTGIEVTLVAVGVVSPVEYDMSLGTQANHCSLIVGKETWRCN